MRVLGARPGGPIDPVPPSVSLLGTDRAEVPSALLSPSLTAAFRDAENNSPSARCFVLGLVLRELCSGLVPTQTRKSPNAAR